MGVIAQAVLIGLFVVFAGTIPRNLIFAANLRFYPAVPWAVPLTAAYLWCFWRYLQGDGPPDRPPRNGARVFAPTASGCVGRGHFSRAGSASSPWSSRFAWRIEWSCCPKQLPDLAQVPTFTVLSLLLMARAGRRHRRRGGVSRLHAGADRAPPRVGRRDPDHGDDVCGRASGFHADPLAVLRGRRRDLRHGHLPDELDLPAVVLHTGGNIYSNIDLWLHGQAEWQAASGPAALVWTTGADRRSGPPASRSSSSPR